MNIFTPVLPTLLAKREQIIYNMKILNVVNGNSNRWLMTMAYVYRYGINCMLPVASISVVACRVNAVTLVGGYVVVGPRCNRLD